MSSLLQIYRSTRILVQSFQDMVVEATFQMLTSQTAPQYALEFVNVLLLPSLG